MGIREEEILSETPGNVGTTTLEEVIDSNGGVDEESTTPDLKEDASGLCGESSTGSWEAPTGPIGLYDPQQEREACGVGFIVSIEGIPSHKVCIYMELYIYL